MTSEGTPSANSSCTCVNVVDEPVRRDSELRYLGASHVVHLLSAEAHLENLRLTVGLHSLIQPFLEALHRHHGCSLVSNCTIGTTRIQHSLQHSCWARSCGELCSP